MRNQYLVILLLLFVASSLQQNLVVEEKQRILQEAIAKQDICLYVLLDAGSSSTKIRLYQSNCRKYSTIPELTALIPDKGINTKYDSALSKVDQSQDGVQKYFEEIFKIVSQIQTSFSMAQIKPFLFLRATAGLRLLPQEQQDAILKFTRNTFSKRTDFIFLDDTWANVITGEDEGLFLWISTNYAFQNIKHGNTVAFDQSKTAAIIDIGGASAQIAFATKTDFNKFLDLPEQTRIQIYSETILGYGNDQVLKSVIKKPNYESCFQTSKEKFTYDSQSFDGSFDFVKCVNVILDFMQIKDCTYQSGFADTFSCSSKSPLKNLSSQAKVIGASSIFYAKSGLGIKDDNFLPQDFRKQVNEYCSKPLEIAPGTSAKDQDILKGSCMQMMWVSTFLIDGLGLLNNQVTSIQQFNNFNIDWSLGSLVYDINTMQCDYIDITQCDTLSKLISTKITEKSSPESSNTSSSSLQFTALIAMISLIVALI